MSKIETVVRMIHGGQIVEAQRRKPCYKQHVEEQAKDAEEFISQGDELGLAMVNCIYEEPQARGAG